MRILFVGFGTVARAAARLLKERQAALLARHGLNPRIVGVADSRGARISPAGLDADELIETKVRDGSVGPPGTDALRMIEECEADAVVEAAPTSISDPRPAIERLKAAFRTGKHVVCVNKGPLAAAMPALRELAEFNRVQFRYSGTVGGGTPVLEWARECAEGDDVLEVRAILNGTSNHILTRMTDQGAAFDDALRDAQAKGCAEADPGADVDGIDAAVKLVILANAVLGRRATLADVEIRGIRGCEPEARAAAAAGKSLKLVARIADRLTVAPEAVAADSPLNVKGTLNAVTLRLRAGGELTLTGRGAGGPETATAVLRDLIAAWHEAWRGNPAWSR